LAHYIVSQLVAAGVNVRCLARGAVERSQKSDVEWVCGDLRDALAASAACAGIDAVFHVAGVAGLWGKWKHFYDNNVLATRNVIEGCRQHRVQKLVFTSSPSVTFDGRPQQNVNEQVGYARRWLSNYSHSKALAEQEVLAANGEGLATCALRPHTIWGPGDRHLLPRIIEKARSGRLRRVGDGQNLIDITYVENAARAHLQAARSLTTGSALVGKPYFISQGEPVNCWQWINEILGLAGLPPVEQSVSLSVAWYAGAACELAHGILGISAEPPMTRYLASLLGTSHYFDISRARQDFGFEPVVTKVEGMLRLAKYIRESPIGFPARTN
jgi:nucleoside-diphosphate-sugar epimerase